MKCTTCDGSGFITLKDYADDGAFLGLGTYPCPSAGCSAKRMMQHFDMQEARKFLREFYQENPDGLGQDEFYSYMNAFGSMTEKELRNELETISNA